MVEYKSLREKFNKRSGNSQNPREFIEIRKGVSLRLILKVKGGNQDFLPFCWF